MQKNSSFIKKTAIITAAALIFALSAAVAHEHHGVVHGDCVICVFLLNHIEETFCINDFMITSLFEQGQILPEIAMFFPSIQYTVYRPNAPPA